MSRIENHIILGDLEEKKMVTIIVDGKEIPAVEGEPILSALLASGIKVANSSPKHHEPRGYFCGIGRCTNWWSKCSYMRNAGRGRYGC